MSFVVPRCARSPFLNADSFLRFLFRTAKSPARFANLILCFPVLSLFIPPVFDSLGGRRFKCPYALSWKSRFSWGSWYDDCEDIVYELTCNKTNIRITATSRCIAAKINKITTNLSFFIAIRIDKKFQETYLRSFKEKKKKKRMAYENAKRVAIHSIEKIFIALDNSDLTLTELQGLWSRRERIQLRSSRRDRSIT